MLTSGWDPPWDLVKAKQPTHPPPTDCVVAETPSTRHPPPPQWEKASQASTVRNGKCGYGSCGTTVFGVWLTGERRATVPMGLIQYCVLVYLASVAFLRVRAASTRPSTPGSMSLFHFAVIFNSAPRWFSFRKARYTSVDFIVLHPLQSFPQT